MFGSVGVTSVSGVLQLLDDSLADGDGSVLIGGGKFDVAVVSRASLRGAN